MSVHTQTYSLLPTMDELLKFKRGGIKGRRAKEIQSLVSTNPMVAEAFGVSHIVNHDEVIAMSNAFRSRLNPFLTPKTSLWWKFVGWFGSIVISLSIVLVFYFQTNKQELVEQNLSNITYKESKPSEPEPAATIISPVDEAQQKEDNTVEKVKIPEKTEPAFVSIEQAKTNKSVTKKQAKTDKLIQKKSTGKKISSKTTIVAQPKVDKTTKISQNRAITKPKTTVMLNLQKVQILQKINPESAKVSNHSSSRYSPLGRDNKTKDNRTFAADDLPEFPGGDAGIQNFFRGIIRPVSVSKKIITSQNRSCYVRILVNSRGKVKETEIIGNPPVEIAKQLKEGLKNLPDFMPGNGNKVEYLISLSY